MFATLRAPNRLEMVVQPRSAPRGPSPPRSPSRRPQKQVVRRDVDVAEELAIKTLLAKCYSNGFLDSEPVKALIVTLRDSLQRMSLARDFIAFHAAELGLGAPAALPSAPVPAAKPSNRFGPKALLESVASGAIAPLRGSWLVKLEARGGRIKRRQDLPAEAFFGADELRKLVVALGEDYGLLFVALSYRWLAKDHPDANGFHLGIVAAVARHYMHKESNKSPLTAAFEAKGLESPDFALLCTLYPLR